MGKEEIKREKEKVRKPTVHANFDLKFKNGSVSS